MFLCSLHKSECCLSCWYFCSCKLGECRVILCEAGAKHMLQKLQLNFPRLVPFGNPNPYLIDELCKLLIYFSFSLSKNK